MEKGALIGQGRTADVYAWGEDRILKLYHADMPRQVVEREFRITQAACAAKLPAPSADQMVEVDGRPGIVFERIQGPSMLKLLSARPWKLVAMARLMGELHAQIHQAAPPPELPTQREQILRGIRAAKDLPEAAREACEAALLRLPEGEPEGSSALCHGDFHPDNILMSARGPVIIDWMTGSRGNPLGDVCRTSLILQTSALPPHMSRPMRVLVNLTRSLIDQVYFSRYRQLHPAGREEIAAWQLPLAAARLVEVENYPREKRLLTNWVLNSLAGDLSGR